MKKRFMCMALAGILTGGILLSACGSSYSSSDAAPAAGATAEEAIVYDDGGFSLNETLMEEAVESEEMKTSQTEADIAEEPAEAPEPAGADSKVKEQKLIYTCDMSLQTLNYTESVAYIREKTAKYGGLVEYEAETDNDYNWYNGGGKRSGTRIMSFRLRIPTENYQSFLKDMEGTGKILSRSSNVQNITKQYNDKTVEIKALQTQEARLLEMMDSAETIEDMIIIEERLTEVQTQLNKYRSQLEQMDTDVAYSTVNLTVEEVIQYTPVQGPEKTETFFDRLKNTVKWTWEFFLELLEGVLFFLIRMIPVLIVAAILAIPARAIWKALRARRAARKSKKVKEAETRAAQNTPTPGTDDGKSETGKTDPWQK